MGELSEAHNGLVDAHNSLEDKLERGKVEQSLLTLRTGVK